MYSVRMTLLSLIYTWTTTIDVENRPRAVMRLAHESYGTTVKLPSCTTMKSCLTMVESRVIARAMEILPPVLTGLKATIGAYTVEG